MVSDQAGRERAAGRRARPSARGRLHGCGRGSLRCALGWRKRLV